MQLMSGLLLVSSGPPTARPADSAASAGAPLPWAAFQDCPGSQGLLCLLRHRHHHHLAAPPPSADTQGAPTVHPGQCSHRLTYISQLTPRNAPEGPSYCDPCCPGDLTGAQGHPAQQWWGRDADPAGGTLGQGSLRTRSSDSLYPAPRGGDLVHPRWQKPLNVWLRARGHASVRCSGYKAGPGVRLPGSNPSSYPATLGKGLNLSLFPQMENAPASPGSCEDYAG